MKIQIGFWLGVFLAAVSGSAQNLDRDEATGLNQTFFISEIFNKYGNNNVMTYEGFEHLLENLGLGKLKFETKHDVSLHRVNGTFREFHDELFLHRHNHDRGDPNTKETFEEKPARQRRYLKAEENVEKTLRRKCLTAQDILVTHGLKPYHEVIISPSKYLQICPAIVYELDQKLCQKEEEDDKEKRHEREEQRLVWISASISILVNGAAGILCALAVPLIKKDYYSWLLQFLVSLGVSTLCGDALIHLIPQVFTTTDGEAASEVITVTRGTVVLLAVYFFFLVENVLKGIQNKKAKNVENGKEIREMLPSFERHEHSRNQEGNGIKTVAWMAIMGDILHNVTDGLSIGAAFSSSLSSGFASSIAIFCHELPHELGDYAILLASGMSIKKSLFYNVVSTVFSFAGMVVGVLMGEIKDASLWINAFTAGSFLYIALSDLVPEMKINQTNPSFKSFVVQTMGLACGGILMFTIALYEDQIERLLC